MTNNHYSKEQLKAINDLIKEFRSVAYTIGEIKRLELAKSNLLTKSKISLSKKLINNINVL